jgi:hypothetical protein
MLRMSVTWYWVKIADELSADPDALWDSIGLRLIDAAPYEPGDMLCRWWRVADRNAGPEYGGRKVELMVTRIETPGGTEFKLDRQLLDGALADQGQRGES